MKVLAHPLVRTWLALMVLLLLTVGSSLIGSWGIVNLVINLSIAAIKAGLIVVFFMEISRSTLSVRFAALAGLVWLALLIGLGLADFMYRLTLG
jgi:cytochrome c oxidase subunit IV